MNYSNKLLSSTFILVTMALTILAFTITMPPVWASGDHGHHDEHEEEHIPEGPHGGRLLQSGDFELEITMAESGIPPEMRVYGYFKGQPINPETINLEVKLERLGGNVDVVKFSNEEAYLVSQNSVAEPHSFTVEVHAKFNSDSFDWHYDNFTGRTEINDRLIKLSDIKTQIATSQKLTFVDILFGVVAPITHQEFSVSAAYTGVIEQLHVNIGDNVEKGQILATVRNSTTLQTYPVNSPANGQVTEQLLSLGDSTFNRSLMRISDLSSVWIDLSAFPKNIQKLSLGQVVTIADDHSEKEAHDDSAKSTISYIAPMMTGGHIARVRAVIDNEHGHWRPGMHIQAEIETRSKQADIAVSVDALQTFMDKPAVFVKQGNTFEARLLTLGESDGKYVEVLAGLELNAEYVTNNSYLLKADIMKNAAKHVH